MNSELPPMTERMLACWEAIPKGITSMVKRHCANIHCEGRFSFHK